MRFLGISPGAPNANVEALFLDAFPSASMKGDILAPASVAMLRAAIAKPSTDAIALLRYRDALGLDAVAEVTCLHCGITLSAAAMLACGSCVS
jgi:hypothetical protein